MVTCPQRLVSGSLLALIMLIFASSAMAQVTARVDRDRLIEGETLTLVLQTNDTRQSLDSDLSALESDFILLDQRSETQMSIANGQQTAVIRKMVTLEPKRAGRLIIPSLKVGRHVTRPITIQVEVAPQPDPGEPQAVFIEVELNPEEGPYYVHAQVGFTVRLFYQQSLTEAAISQPEPQNASVRLLDEVPFQAERGGHRYRVLERHYALFPERSGDMLIPPVVLSGRLVDRGSDRMWQPSRRGRRVTVQSEPINVEVSPRPASFSGDTWQPARSYRLGEELSVSGEIRVGEPVTRTVIIDAVGLEENMIAEPQWPEIPDSRIYPDQPQGISRDDGNWVLGHKEFRYAVVPEREGSLLLPELQVVWWDTVTNQERVSVLPSRTITVLPSAASIASAPAQDIPDTELRPDALSAPAQLTGGYWRWLTILFAVLWLSTLMIAVRFPRRVKATPKTTTEIDEAALLGEFKRACSAGNAAAARQALRSWLKRFAPHSNARLTPARSSLVEFAHRCGSESLGEAVREMDAAGFNPAGDKSWSGNTLYRAFQEWRRSAQGNGKSSPAPIIDLYAPANRRAG